MRLKSYIRYNTYPTKAAVIPVLLAFTSTPLSDGLQHCQRSLHTGHHPGRKDIQAQRLGRTFGRRDESISPRRGNSWQSFELFPLVRPYDHGQREMCGGAPRPARSRRHGLGFCDELCQRQWSASGRSLFAARPTPKKIRSTTNRLGAVFCFPAMAPNQPLPICQIDMKKPPLVCTKAVQFRGQRTRFKRQRGLGLAGLLIWWSGSGCGKSQSLDFGAQAALITSSLVFVEDALVGNDVHHGLHFGKQLCGFGLVACCNGFFNVFHSSTVFGAQ